MFWPTVRHVQLLQSPMLSNNSCLTSVMTMKSWLSMGSTLERRGSIAYGMLNSI